SRRRHTRWPRDWSSDVCSSDLIRLAADCDMALHPGYGRTQIKHYHLSVALARHVGLSIILDGDPERIFAPSHPVLCRVNLPRPRSEERRVGKEWRSGGATYR